MHDNMEMKKRTKLEDVWKRFLKNKLAVAGMVVFILLLLVAVFADVLVDYEGVALHQDTSIRSEKPSSEHPFGTDQYGRDVLARIIHGARLSLLIGVLCAVFSTLIGGIIGAIAGYYGGFTDNILMRLMDVLLAIPAILLAIAIITALGAGVTNLVIAITISSIPGFARLVRVSVLSVRSQEYIEAAHSIGCSDFIIIFKYIIPNVVGPVIVQTTQTMATSILAASGLSFIGLGVQPPSPEWGTMLSEAADVIRYSPYLILFPGLAIFITVLAINFLGDGLRDALDPRLK